MANLDSRQFLPLRVFPDYIVGNPVFPRIHSLQEVIEDMFRVSERQNRRLYVKQRDVKTAKAVVQYLVENGYLAFLYGKVTNLPSICQYKNIDVVGVSSDERKLRETSQVLASYLFRTETLSGQDFYFGAPDCLNSFADLQVRLVPVQGRVGRRILPRSSINLALMSGERFSAAKKRGEY